MTDTEKKPSKPKRTAAKRSSAKRASNPNIKVQRVGVVTRAASDDAIRTAAELADWLHRRDIKVALDETSLTALD